MAGKITLSTKCPHCSESLMDNEVKLHDHPSIKLNIESSTDRGTIRLCAIYGCYDHSCDIELTEKDIAKFYCPHCNKQLISNDECDDPNCNAPMIPLTCQAGGKVFFCSRKGCTKHFVAFEDLSTAIMNANSQF